MDSLIDLENARLAEKEKLEQIQQQLATLELEISRKYPSWQVLQDRLKNQTEALKVATEAAKAAILENHATTGETKYLFGYSVITRKVPKYRPLDVMLPIVAENAPSLVITTVDMDALKRLPKDTEWLSEVMEDTFTVYVQQKEAK